jgi:hypothetical protein
MNPTSFDSERSAFFVAGDRFEYETYHEGHTVIHRGRITKFVVPDYFEGFLDNGSFVCGDSRPLERIPRYISAII